ncbi:restriction endonuclease [Enterovirga rhinocerotis]|uniref:Restriction system protein n=1 Tax=Enterovirga rhinocerotis TaxID=1339210 RepID=A0A4R7BNZ7_9HYPH|nr:restriction endonuclease [Enterovirga rhinocerotis]TDR87081.1 restriction system protein [Enterovirga rhinocerotis]
MAAPIGLDTILVAVAALLAPLLLFCVVVYRRQSAAIRSAMATASDVIGEHLETLTRRRAMLIRIDDYGVADTGRWQDEIRHFVDNVIRPRFSEEERRAVARGDWLAGHFRDEIEDRVLARARSLESANQAVSALTPGAFEAHCAGALTARGWSARTTVASGDQGADIIAEKSGVRLVVQCKLFQRPVGNKAVQEAFAAREHYGAHHAAVVTNAEFTRSARDLAATTGVVLLHYTQMSGLDRLGPE